MALLAVRELFNSDRLKAANCRGLVIAASSLSHPIGQMISEDEEVNSDSNNMRSLWRSLEVVTQAIDGYLNNVLDPRNIVAINWGCSAFPKAVEESLKMADRIDLNGNQYILVVTTSRLSQVMDWKSSVAAIFGDAATAFAIVPNNASIHNSREVILAQTAAHRVEGSNFFCAPSKNAVRPVFTDNQLSFGTLDEEIGLLTMNPSVIANNAPRILLERTNESLNLGGINLDSIDSWVPHQAGREILENFLGAANVDPNKVVKNFRLLGNLSSSSIPCALREAWEDLRGETVACPSVGAGPVGTPWMSSGMVILGRANQ